MTKLNRLIKGQDLAFDTHQAGDGQPINWRDLHMEKRLHGGRGKLKFPLFGGQEPSKPQKMSKEDYQSTISEVRRVLRKNSSLVSNLAETITDQIKKFSSQNVTIEQAEEAANKIAATFGLDNYFVEDVVSKFRISNKYSNYYIDKSDNLLYQVSISRKEVEVSAARLHIKKQKRANK